MQKSVIVAFIIFFIFVSCPRAYAYLDPGSGSYLWQLLIAGALGVLFSLKRLFKGKKRH